MKAIYFVDAGFLLRAAFKMVSPILPARTQAKIKMLDRKALNQELQMPLD